MKNLSPERLEYLLSNMPTDMSFYEQKIKEIGLFDFDGIYATDVRTGMLRYAREAEERNQYAANKLRIAFENVWEAEEAGVAKLREIREELEEYSAYIQRLGNALNTDNGLSADKKKKYIGEISTLVKNNTNLEENQETENIIDFFLTCDSKTQLIIQILDRKMVEELGITDIEERKRIMQTLLTEKPNIFMQLYMLNAYSGTDFQRVLYNVLFNIEQDYRGLSEKGLEFLYDIELGGDEDWRKSEYVKFDENGELVAMQIHDAKDGGYTIGPGIYLSEDEDEKIEYAEELDIEWNKIGEWVSIDKIRLLFDKIVQYPHTVTKEIEAKLGVIFTQEQYDAVFSLIYWKPFLNDTIIQLIASQESREQWVIHIKNALVERYGNTIFEVYPGWIPRIEKGVDLYFYGVY